VQDDAAANYAAKLEKHEALIDWQQSAQVIDRQIRAFNPWPVAETKWNAERLRLWNSHVVSADELASLSSSAQGAVVGQVVKCDRSGLWVQCAGGVLGIDELQMPGKRAMSVIEFVNANDLTGVVLGDAPGRDADD